MIIKFSLLKLIDLIYLVPPRGRDGLKHIFGDWKYVPMYTEPPVEVSISEIAVGPYKNLSNYISGTLKLDKFVFHNMDLIDFDQYNSDYTTIKYTDGCSNNVCTLDSEMWYSYFGIRLESLLTKATINGPKGTVTCNVLGLTRFDYGLNGPIATNLWIRYHDSNVYSPFKSVRLIQFEQYPDMRNTSFWLFIDPECSGFNQRQCELFSLATSKAEPLQAAIRSLIVNFMRNFYYLNMIEPHRFSLEGRI